MTCRERNTWWRRGSGEGAREWEGFTPKKEQERGSCLQNSCRSQHLKRTTTFLLPYKHTKALRLVSTSLNENSCDYFLQAVVELCTETAAPSPALATRALTPTTLTANGPSLLHLEGLSPSAFTLSALTILETVSRTISYSSMDQMWILHPLDHIVEQWVTQIFLNFHILCLNSESNSIYF